MIRDLVLLAAGSGRRFGGDKLLYRVGGIPMIEHACALYAGIPFRRRILVVRPEDDPVAECGQGFGFEILSNPDHEKGIGTSTAVGAKELLRDPVQPDAVLYAVSDQPYLERDTVRRLMDAWEEHPGSICLPLCSGKRGNPVLFPGDLLGELALLDEDIGGKAVIRRHEDRVFPVESVQPMEMKDIDYREEERHE